MPAMMPDPNFTAEGVGVMNLDGQNQYYRVCFYSLRHGLVWAWLPDDFTMTLVEAWDYVVGGGRPALTQVGTELFLKGRVPTTKYQTAKVWTGEDPLTFMLPLKFVARRDSDKEVIQPLKRLLKIAAPRSGGNWMIYPPGPSLVTDLAAAFGARFNAGSFYEGAGDEITLYVGSYIRIPKIFIQSLQITFNSSLDQNGMPMRGECMLTCCTLYAPTDEDIEAWISPGVAAAGNRPGPYVGTPDRWSAGFNNSSVGNSNTPGAAALPSPVQVSAGGGGGGGGGGW